MAAQQDQRDDYKIGDPEEISQQKRIHELLSRRSDVLEARNAAIDAATMGGASELEAKEYYQGRIQPLIIDLWTKFENSDLDIGQKYLQTQEIDTFWVDPPEELLSNGTGDMAAGEDEPDPEPYTINGLQWFIDNKPVVEVPFEAYRWNPPGRQAVTKKHVLKWNTLDKALINCVKFIDETGIDADLEIDDSGDHGFPYEDILEEGEDKRDGEQGDPFDPQELKDNGGAE